MQPLASLACWSWRGGQDRHLTSLVSVAAHVSKACFEQLCHSAFCGCVGDALVLPTLQSFFLLAYSQFLDYRSSPLSHVL